MGLLEGLLEEQVEHHAEEEEVNNRPLLLNPTSWISDHKQMGGVNSGYFFLMY